MNESNQSNNEFYKIKINNFFELLCPVFGGNPPPQIRWLLNNVLIEFNNIEKEKTINGIQHTILENGKKLAIMGKNSANNRYTCVAENKVGTTSKDFIIEVY